MKTIKFLLTTIAVLLCSVMANAYDFYVDGIYYNITSSTYLKVEVTYEYKGAWVSYVSNYSGAVIIPSTVAYEGSTYSVTSIGEGAFYSCDSLTSVTIPNSVTSIGRFAFSHGSGLTSVEIPNSVTTIGESAFSYCGRLTSVTIPNSVTNIGENAFWSCDNLTSVHINDIDAWCRISFDDEDANPLYYANNLYIGGDLVTNLVIPNSVTSIRKYAFYGCECLVSLTIPKSVTSIGYDAFSYCYLDSVTINSNAIVNDPTYWDGNNFSHKFGMVTKYIIGEDVKGIGKYAFWGCYGLTSVTIPNSVTSIGEGAFGYCHDLTSVYINDIDAWCRISFADADANPLVYANNLYIGGDLVTNLVIPNGITSVKDYAFYGCYSLTSVTIPNSVTSIGRSAFSNCSGLTSVEIPNSVTSIGSSAFYNCDGLTSVEIPNSVTSIGNSAFYNCDGLTSVEIPNSVTSIEYRTFDDCDGLTSVTIPNSVTSIGESAFSSCDGLTSVTIPNSVTSIGESAFYDCNSLNSITIGQRVKSIGWSAFAYTNLNSVTLPRSLELIEEYAFYDCKALYDIYCYAKMPPAISESSFVNYNAYVHVPCDSKRYYQADMVWSLFPNIQCIESDEVKTDGVVVTPSTNDVTIIWPTSDSADTYTIIIKQGNDVFCTLTFNADGQLLNIAFAPSRDGDNRPAQYAEQAVNGYRFTITGLEEATHYAYNITAKDASGKTIKDYSGEFDTQSLTAVENVEVGENTNIQKILRDGQLLILRDGVEYNVMGQEM